MNVARHGRRLVGAVGAGWLVIALAAGVAAARPRRPRAGAALTVAELAWPATVRSAEARGRTIVFRGVGRGRVGKLAKGTRVGWKRIVASRDRCRAWLEIEPRGWVCAKDLAPSDLAPAAGIDPERIIVAVEAKAHAGVIPAGAYAYATAVAVRAAKPTRRVAGWSFLHAATPVVTLGSKRFYKSHHGYIAASQVVPRAASTFAGIDLAAAPSHPWPFAWVTPARRDGLVAVRPAPDPAAPAARTLARREVVAVHEVQAGFARIGAAEWIAVAELRVARPSPRPTGVRPDERWIDVDLDQQVLVAYAGDVPVFATMVSSGRGRSTPTAIHRIEEKRATGRMKSPEVSLGKWDVPEVPFAMTFREHYAVHGAYWHDSFGKPRSQGCLNVSPRDARFLFGWTFPQIPDGWLSAVADHHDGTPIRLRNRRDPDPAWTDFHAPPPVPTRRLPVVADGDG